ncbi:MAG: response regulator [Rhodocyclaceae bacterium]|nr:response regulator [Rhodocyclaceae bacterium]
MHRSLQRQLKRIAGVADDAALGGLLQELRDIAGQPGITPEASALLRGLPEFLERIDGAYEQYDRDLALRTRSLELSSEDLLAANERLRADLASRNRALAFLRETALGLLAEEGEAAAAASLASNDLESLSILMARLVEQRELQRRELDNQKFALDQHAIVSITDTQGVIVYANDRFCEISGYSRAELIGQPHRIVKSGLHPPAVFADMWDTISSGRVWHGEICNRRKNGDLYWVAATIVPFLDHAGLPTRYIGIRTDITERKAIEAQLEDQLQLVEELIEAIPLPLYLKDPKGRYQCLNRAFEMFFGVRREDVLYRTVAELLPPDEAPLHVGKDAELYAGGGSQTYEARVTTRDGTAHDTIYRKAILRLPDGSIRGLLGTIIDITDRKQAEVSLLRAMEAAEAANRAKSDFLANMSHEIRTPMNGVIGMTELALGCRLDDEPREYLQIVKSSAESLLTIINDILDFSKIEAGRMEIERISFHLPRLCADMMKTLALRAHEKQLELVLDIDPAVPGFVFGDPGRLRQVLVNLIGNALKFTERGEIVLRVAPAEAPGNICCEVRDTGIGIAEDKLGHIFEAFAQEDSSTTRRFGGTGLGLTISRRLVAMMGGAMAVESRLGAGSVFRVAVPLPADAGRREKEDAPRVPLAGLPVLLVDDNETNRMVLSRMFAGWGMRVEAFASAGALLERLRADDLPALIILDAQMPEMDGFTLAECLRDDPRLAGIPRVMLSSGAVRGDAARCRELGIAAYFGKPVAQAELLVGLHSVLGAAATAPELVTRHSLREARTVLDVLLVEDHPINQKLAISLLEKWGHRVSLATNGAEAIERVASGHFDVILMDLQMPGMGGLEATQRLRMAGCRTRIVAMTANAMAGDRELCLAAGMDDYLAKPIKADELFALLHESVAAGGERTAEPDNCAGPVAEPVAPAFDYRAALAQMDAELVAIIAPLFVEACPDDLAALRRALAAEDTVSAHRQAHTLRGLAGQFNATPAVEAGRTIEDALARHDIAAAQASLPNLETALADLIATLREDGQVR